MDSAQMTQLAERQKNKAVCLPICSSDYLCSLTFHTEFGAPAVFVDENKKDQEEDASEARQANSDGNLGETKMLCQTPAAIKGMCSHHNLFPDFWSP